MPMIKSNSQFGGYLFECVCGSHLVRIIKDEPTDGFPTYHSLMFYEFRGDTSWTLWDRIKLAFRVLIGKEAKRATYDVLITNDDIDGFIEAFQKLKEPSEHKRITLKELREKINNDI